MKGIGDVREAGETNTVEKMETEEADASNNGATSTGDSGKTGDAAVSSPCANGAGGEVTPGGDTAGDGAGNNGEQQDGSEKGEKRRKSSGDSACEEMET